MTSELDQFFQDEPQAAGRNDLDQFFDDGSAARAKLGVRFAGGSSPDQEAEAVKLARRYSIPPALASQFVEDYRERAKADDANAVIDNSPKLRDWLAADTSRAKVASDDIQTLGSIESILGTLKKSARYVASADDERGLLTDTARAARSLVAGAPTFSAGVYGALAYPFEAVGADSVGGFFRNEQRAAMAQGDRWQGADPNAGLLERGIMSGFRSAGQQLVTLPVGFANTLRVTGQQVMLGLMGLTSFGQSYGKGRNEGESVGTSAFYGLTDATAEVVTERFLGAAGLIGDAKVGMSAAKMFIRDIAREIPGEMGATLWQNFNEWTLLNPEKTVGEFLSEQPEALAETIVATIAGGGAQVGAISVAQKVSGQFDGEARRTQDALRKAGALEELNKFRTASKVAQRDATTFKQLVAEIADEEGDAPTELFIDHGQLLNTLNQSGMTMVELEAIAPSVAAQLNAPDTGGLVRVPVSEFLAAGEDLTAPLIDHMRIGDAEAPTRAEAREFEKTFGERVRSEMEAQMLRQDDQAAFRESIEGARSQFEQSLNAAKRFTPSVNKAYADLLANFYGATASRLGMTPQALLQKYRLDVVAKGMGGERTLNQSAGFYALTQPIRAEDAAKLIAGKTEKPGGTDPVKLLGASEGNGKQFRIGDIPLDMIADNEDGERYDSTVNLELAKDYASRQSVSAPPVIALEPRKGGKLRIHDGGHRITAARLRGDKTIRAIVAARPNDPNILNQSAADIEQAIADPAATLLLLGQDESLYQYPKSDAKALAEIAADKNPALKVTQESITQQDGSEKPTGNWEIITPQGDTAILTEQGNEVWINVAGLAAGREGSLVYDLAANYALNNGKVFIGDPAGLSDAAMVRRAENMLSSAVKYGTTDHLAPHQKQVAGSDKVPPLKWTEGDTLGNIRALMEVTTAANDKLAPAGAGVRYDAATDRFIDSEGNELEGTDGIAVLSDLDRGASGAGAPGEATLRRNALFHSLLSGEDQRRAVLGRLRGQQGDGGAGTGGALKGSFYQGDVTPRAQIAFGDDITAAPSVIALLEGADLSSFIHESGHFFLEVQSDLAARIQQQIDSGASVTAGERAVVDDMNRLLGWFGIKGNENQTALTEWAGMTLDEKREHHETFARGFERYTMEGKAPSIELQTVFSRFRSWLVQVYKTLRGLNVDLNDDVRAVMGRMLATDFAIEEAEAQRSMGPLFRDAQKAGMTLDEFATYQAIAQAATDQAAADLQVRSMKDLKWLSRARDKALKARQEEVDSLRRDIRNEVRSEVMREPVYQAWQFLTGKEQKVAPGEQSAEDVDTVQQSGRLRTQVLRDMYGTEETAIWRELSARRMTSDSTGLHPEIVADMFGYDSADAMVKALVQAMPPQEVIDARTDQRMLEMFGDIASPEALQRAADEAIHNEVRARFIATEMKALEAANKVSERRGKSSVDLLNQAAKGYAREIVARLKVREIRPSQYASAEARSAKLADKAFTAGKRDEAAMHKRNQLVNNHATRAAYDALDEVKKAQDYFRKFDKRSKTIDGEYQDQIEQMLERFDFKPVSLKEIDQRKSLSQWYADQVAVGAEPNIPPELLNEANRKSYKDMTLEELRGLRETVEQIEHLGRLKNKLLLARDQRDFDAAATEMAESIVAYGGKARPVDLEGPNPVKDWLEGAAAAHRKLASLFRQMDGNRDQGPMYDLIGRGMNERGVMEDVMVEQATERLRAIYAPVLKLKGGITGYRSKIFIPEINASLTRGGRLAVALNWGNEANRQRLMDGDKWSEAQVRAILRTLSPVELKFVNDTWAFLDSYWEEIAAKEKRLTGVEPEKVQALPFNTIASDGTEVVMRGGYYPLKYDADRSDRASQQEAAQVAKEMMQGAFTRATTRRGHTKARQEEVKRAVRKDLNVITQHVTQVTHDLAWHEWLIDTNKLIGDERVATAIREHYGPKVLKTIRDDIMGIATADVATQSDIDKMLLMLRSNVTRATMGASLTTAFLQPFGLTQSMVRIGPKHVLRGMARWGGDAARMENTVGWIKEKSEFMRLRSKTLNKELREIRGSVAGKSKTMRVVDAGLFALMQKMQLVADVPTWVGQYEKSLSEGLDEAAAVAMADRAVLESQGGGQTKDLAEVQRKHPMLTQFYSYFSVTLNLAAEQTAATNFKNPAAVAGWLGDMALLMVIPAILPSLLMHLLKGGDDDELPEKLVEWQAGYLLGTVVGLREFSGAIGGFDYAGPPVARIVGDVSKAGKQTAQGEMDDAAVAAYINLMGTAFGIPTTQIMRSYKGWKAWDEGQEGAGPASVLFGPPPKK